MFFLYPTEHTYQRVLHTRTSLAFKRVSQTVSEVNTLDVVNVVSGGVNQEPPSPAWPKENDPARQACTSTGRTWSSQTSQLTRSARPTPLRPFTPLSPTVLVLVESDLDIGGVGVGAADRGLGEGASTSSSGCRERAWGKDESYVYRLCLRPPLLIFPGHQQVMSF